MPEELQSLIDRIQKEGIEKARAEASEIIAAAKVKAEETNKAAKQKAQAVLTQAEADARIFSDRSIKILEQAARDILITIKEGIEKTFESIVADAVAEAITPKVLGEMLVSIVHAYAAQGMIEDRLTVLLNHHDQEQLQKLFMGTLQAELKKGLEIKTDDRITGGFKVSLNEGRIQHDFTRADLTDVLCIFLRPHLAEIVRKATEKTSKDSVQ